MTDEEGRPVGVFISYDEWLRIKLQLLGTVLVHGVEAFRHHEGMTGLSEDPAAY